MITSDESATSGRIGGRARRDVSSGRGSVRVLLCSPQLMMRQALTTVLSASSRLRVLGDVGSGKDALRWALEVRPDVTVLDAFLSPVDGVHAATAIHAEDPGLKLVTLCDDEGASDVDDGGAVSAARISKKLCTRALVEVLVRVADGEVPGDVPARGPRALVPKVAAAMPGLRPSERVLLELLVVGSDNRAVAEQLGCSEKTVRNRLSDLYAKLHLHNRTQAALYALRHGLGGDTGVIGAD